jgi:hypothetical protein
LFDRFGSFKLGQQETGRYFPNAACAAANRAIGTRNGLQLT